MTVRPMRPTLAGAAIGLLLGLPIALQVNAGTSSAGGATAQVVAGAPLSPPTVGASPPPASVPPPAAAAPVTVVGTGPVVPNRYGPVQVEVTLTDGRIVDVRALQLPFGGQSGQISRYAEPQLHQEALAAQSAQVDTVSGASYTSDGYRTSLQAALDAARAASNTQSPGSGS